MLLLVKMFKKKGISAVIGYILLITFAIIISALLYQWLRSYVPRESLECPDGVSLFLKDYIYDCTGENIHITLKNNGRFNIAGYFIHATNRPDQKLATINLIDYTDAEKGHGAILLGDENNNTIEPGEEIGNDFDLTGSDIGRIYSLQIIPVRWQEAENRIKFVSCGKAKIEEELICFSGIPGECNFNDTCDAGETCSNCPSDCGACCGNGILDSGEECDDDNTISGDGCSSTCKREWFVFVSSAVYHGDMNSPEGLTGLGAGDTQCKTLADNSEALVNLNGKNWKAWLSTSGISGVDAKDRIKDGIYILPDGTKIAENLNDLIDGILLNPININDRGEIPSTSSSYVWTGTNEFGLVISGEAIETNCNQWSEGAASVFGWKGNWSALDLRWTNIILDTSDRKCSQTNRIYCFEV